jgi:hypothetical protein
MSDASSPNPRSIGGDPGGTRAPLPMAKKKCYRALVQFLHDIVTLLNPCSDIGGVTYKVWWVLALSHVQELEKI